MMGYEKTKFRAVAVWLVLLSTWSCTNTSTNSREVHLSFYHWQSELDLDHQEKSLLDSLEVERLYLRYFDLDWDVSFQEVVPLGVLQPDTTLPPGIAIVPVVFITNRSFFHLEEKDLPALGEKMLRKIADLNKQLEVKSFAQLQIDCDWTEKTRYLYFRFLEILKTQIGKAQLSTTIRLHQVKYLEKTGVPPVDRGMLMFYNTGDLENPATGNSILDWSTAERYTARLQDYPLVLDLALPVFSWGVLFRQGKMIKLINNLRNSDLQDPVRFKQLDGHWVEVLKSTYIQGFFLYQGDRLRLEKTDPALLNLVSTKLDKQWPGSKLDLVFYHLDHNTLKHFSYAHFIHIQEIFGHSAER